MIEFLERLGVDDKGEQWLVRARGVYGIAHVYDTDDPMWTQAIDEDTGLWEGFTHEHLTPVYQSRLERDRLVIIVGDERGPSFVQAARLLPEPVEREQWAVVEIAGVADAVVAMGAELERRAPGVPPFVHRRAYDEHIVVGSDGKARLRSPIAWIPRPRGHGWLGRGNSLHASFAWMSPEHARGKVLTPASDVYCLAATLYGALTLRRPFAADDDFRLLTAIATGPRPGPLDCTPALSELVLRNLAIEPGERDPDPATFAANLRRIHHVANADLRARVAALRPERRPAPHESSLVVGSRCPKRWDELAPTTQDGIRHCAQCNHDVVHVRSLEALVPLLGKRCVSFDPGGN